MLFKGYVFMITDHVDDLYTQLKKVPDLTKLLGNDGENIYPIYKEEAMFLSQVGGQKHLIDISIGYIEGDTIKVTSGPLMGIEGLIRKIDRHKRIAFIEVSLLGQSRIVQIALEIIKKI
ncbi:antiterminator LoaP [Massilimicrobiota sp. An134]|uniref:antiterminator LoaP n=1 Tax=Massilimicrobiota sp. An134 TaxID=1965557 RepID=UPI00210168A0|nr:antiterminator LoaP [Massilimicrobiota sp. An134]